jgi:hypothetical protein
MTDPARHQRIIDHWNEVGKCLHHSDGIDLERLAGRLFGFYGDHVPGPIRHDWEADARHLLSPTDD